MSKSSYAGLPLFGGEKTLYTHPIGDNGHGDVGQRDRQTASRQIINRGSTCKIRSDPSFTATAILLVIALMLLHSPSVLCRLHRHDGHNRHQRTAYGLRQALDAAAIDGNMADALKRFDCPGASSTMVKGGRLLSFQRFRGPVRGST